MSGHRKSSPPQARTQQRQKKDTSFSKEPVARTQVGEFVNGQFVASAKKPPRQPPPMTVAPSNGSPPRYASCLHSPDPAVIPKPEFVARKPVAVSAVAATDHLRQLLRITSPHTTEPPATVVLTM